MVLEEWETITLSIWWIIIINSHKETLNPVKKELNREAKLNPILTMEFHLIKYFKKLLWKMKMKISMNIQLIISIHKVVLQIKIQGLLFMQIKLLFIVMPSHMEAHNLNKWLLAIFQAWVGVL
jgi:hypothetical protein